MFHFRLKNIPYQLIILAAGACKIMDPPAQPVLLKTPTSFSSAQTGTAAPMPDSIDMSPYEWRQFFQDSMLIALIDSALQRNYDLAVANQRIEFLRLNFELSRRARLPSLDLRFRGRTGDLTTPHLENTINGVKNLENQTQNYFFGLQSFWEIDIWGKLKNKRQAAYFRYMSSEKGRHLLTTTIVSQVARLYYSLLALDNELQIIEKNIALQRSALATVKIQKAVGGATQLAVQQFEAQLARTQALGVEKQQSIVEIENDLNVILGRYPQPIERTNSIFDQTFPDSLQMGVPSRMLLYRPDLQQEEFNLLASKADLQAARAAFLPTFSITPYGGVHGKDFTAITNMPQAWIVGFISAATAPIFLNRQIKTQYQQSVSKNRESFYAYQQAILKAFSEVSTAVSRLQNNHRIYQFRRHETDVMLNSVTTANDLYTAGKANYLEIITAQEKVLQAELSLTDARKKMFLSSIFLYRSLGGGWE
jgi:NodT family efflux transporter outer membrane factor (OMF) lipoprotein